MNKLLVRYTDLVPSDAGLLETCTSGPVGDQDFIIIGGPMTHPAAAHVHITAPHGFSILGRRQAVGGVAVAQCRDAAEVLIVHSGRWRLALGLNREEGSVELALGDVASVPPGVFRRVEKIDEGVGFLFSVRGSSGDRTPTWAPAVFSDWHGFAAEIPAADWDAPVTGKLSDCVIAASVVAPNPVSRLAADGIEEAGIVAPCATRDGFTIGPLKGWWPHGFNLRRLTLQSGAYVPMHYRAESEVFMLHEGTLEVSWADGAIMMGSGDTLTVPAGLPHALRNTTSKRTQVFVVRGSEDPAVPTFESTAHRR